MTQHHPQSHHHHRHRHRMEIVLENPILPSAASSNATTTTTAQLGLPMRLPHHFPHRTAYDVGLGRSSSLSPAEEYYARNRHGPTLYGNLDGAPAPVTVRRIDKSGLLEIADTDPLTCQRPCVLMGAEDVAARTVSLRVDRSGLLEAVPETVDQLEEHCNNDEATTNVPNEAAAVPRGETLTVDVDMNPRVLEGGCLLQRPSSLEGQACPDETDTRRHSANVKVLTGSPRTQLEATERLSHMSFSPDLSLRHYRNDPSRCSPLISRCANADAVRSSEIAAKCNTSANSVPRKLASPSRSPITCERLRIKCSREDVDVTSINPDDHSTLDTSKPPRESSLTKGNIKRTDEPPGEERAEAEGCEHTTVESLEEDEVSFKGSNKLLDNDNVQTLRVIILSEQL